MKTFHTVSSVFIIITLAALQAAGQSYTTLSSGAWTTAAKWNNTSGWGTTTPPIDGSHGSGTITMAHSMTISTNYIIGSSTLNINAGQTLSVVGSMTLNGGSTVNVSGILAISGNLTLNSIINILPGGQVIIDGNAIINSSNYLRVGTAVAPPAYADLIVKQNIQMKGSGDVTVNQNGRVAVYGNVTSDTGGDARLVVNNGGQMYVNGNINFVGGGDDIVSSATSPYGLFVNGTVTNSGGGSTTTSNKGDKSNMQSTSPGFYGWVASLPGSPLPVTMMFFEVSEANANNVSLKWATASEVNFDYFSIERSSDGIAFTEVDRVQGHGNSKDRNDYTYTDYNVLTGKSYYRLKSIDFDGYSEVFKVVSVSLEDTKTVAVFPIPVTDHHIHVNFNFTPVNTAVIVFTDLNGTEVSRLSTDSQENDFSISLNTGTYVMVIRADEFSKVTRVVVR